MTIQRGSRFRGGVFTWGLALLLTLVLAPAYVTAAPDTSPCPYLPTEEFRLPGEVCLEGASGSVSDATDLSWRWVVRRNRRMCS